MAIQKKEELIKQIRDLGIGIKKVAVDAAHATGDAIADGKKAVADQIDQAKTKHDISVLQPVFENDIKADEYVFPPMIRISEPDTAHLENPVCNGAIGHNIDAKDMTVLNIYPKNAASFGLTFYPSLSDMVYYVDPCHPNVYISINDYFNYLKKVRVDELNSIAQDLGATHIKITLKAEKKTFVEQKGKVKLGLGKAAGTTAEKDSSNKAYESIDVASDCSFAGHEAQEPKLVYFKNETDIINLINARMHDVNPILSKTITFKYINSSGIKESEALKIEGALKKMKLGGNASISSEVQEENRMYFEYAIEFPKNE